MARIVLIEDDPTLRALVQHTLESDGHTVSVAADGRDGLQHVRDSATDLVITDVIMPDKDGLEIIADLQNFTPRPRVIAISGGGYFSREALLRMAKQLGAWGVLPKPFSPEELKRSIAAALNHDEVAVPLHGP